MHLLKLSLLASLAVPLLVSAAPPPAAPATATKLLPRFPDFGYLTDAGDYTGRTFKLSQDYPATRPAIEPAVAKILAIDFTKDWRAYMDAVQAYVYEGNIHGGPVGEDFYLEDNKIRPWFHVPWQHASLAGREGIHGLTAEATAQPGQFSASQTKKWQAFAVGFYNAPGGWAIGQVWADASNPQPDLLAKAGFPVGTVVAKLLFTDAPVAEVPFLTNPVNWNGYVFDTPFFVGVDDPKQLPGRKLQQLRLLQMDIMVRDDRAKATGGWVFGTFVYNGAKNRLPLWNNLMPVGISWGNDPTVTSMAEPNLPVERTRINPDLKHTIINRDKDLPPQHLGFGMRLSGPADNPSSSCQSCHMTAEYPQISAIVPLAPNFKPYCPGSPAAMRWFQDVPVGTAFDKKAVNTDNSLQMSASYNNFIKAQAAATGGKWAVQYWQGSPVNSVVALRGGPDATKGCVQ